VKTDEFGIDEEVTITFWLYPLSTTADDTTLWKESDITFVNAYDQVKIVRQAKISGSTKGGNIQGSI